ncbi:MAG TPA: response regulator transcription factor [Candidatus Binatia bacterium]
MAKTTPSHSTSKKRSILLVDDHPIVLEGLKQLIEQQADLMVCGELADGRATLQTVARLRPDLAIIDISLKGVNGLEIIKALKAQYPDLPVLALSMHDETLYAERALRAGANGYVMKQEATKNLLTAARQLLTGGIYLSENVTAKLLSRVAKMKPGTTWSALEELSDRELQVFQLIGQGASTRRIAEMLRLSIKTIESHRENIKRKLKLQDAAELVQYAISWAQTDSLPKSRKMAEPA